MAYRVMAHIGMPFRVIPYIVMAGIVVGFMCLFTSLRSYIGITDIGMADIVMADIVVAYSDGRNSYALYTHRNGRYDCGLDVFVQVYGRYSYGR